MDYIVEESRYNGSKLMLVGFDLNLRLFGITLLKEESYGRALRRAGRFIHFSTKIQDNKIKLIHYSELIRVLNNPIENIMTEVIDFIGENIQNSWNLVPERSYIEKAYGCWAYQMYITLSFERLEDAAIFKLRFCDLVS